MPTTSPGAPGANPFEQARVAARELGRMTGAERHDVLVVLGIGLFAVADALGATGPPLDLTSLPWFARFTGPGHRPEAWSVDVEGKRTLIVAGRLHPYEGRSPAEVVHTVRTAIAAGAKVVVLTSSAGAVDPALAAGDVVLIRDHLNLTGTSPLAGIPADGASPRDMDMTDAWTPRWREVALGVAGLKEGVYAQMAGPEPATPAETRMLGALGADVVGMSTVLEAVAARHLGADVLGLAVVTRAATGPAPEADDDEVRRITSAAVPTIAQVVTGVVRAFADAEKGEGAES